MTKLSQSFIIVACMVLLAGGAGGAWLLKDRLISTPKATTPQVEYNAFVTKIGGEEPTVRDELNGLISTSSAAMDDKDRERAHALSPTCLDVRDLMAIGHVRAFLSGSGEGKAYHFVSEEHRTRLRTLAGDRPSAEKVLEIRKLLFDLSQEFALLRQPPEFKVTIEGESPPAMPFLAILSESHLFLQGQQPVLRENPRIPAFSSADGELLVQLEQFFNSSLVAKALPAARFPKLYRNGHMPAIPANITEYQQTIGQSVLSEKKLILPDENPDPEGVQAVDEVYVRLERFFSAIVAFQR